MFSFAPLDAAWQHLVRPLLFQLDPETIHELAVGTLAVGERWFEGHPAPSPTSPRLRQVVWGLEFPNPLGLAAGFDKNAALPHVWRALGFGFAELGTVTACEQPGNPRPRLFRLPEDRALVNRLGFNNEGADRVARSLAARLTRPAGIPLGINLGKSRATPLEEATADYVASFRKLAPLADYLVVNVSSPNTPGLRDLQGEEQLRDILSALVRERRQGQRQGQIRGNLPLLVKVAPDLAEDGLEAIVRVVREEGGDGFVATNTTVARTDLRSPLAGETGGLSGVPLRARSTAVIRHLRQSAGAGLPIIGVGGVFTADDAMEKLRAGASLVQAYTGFIYGGPTFPRRIVADLDASLAREGMANVQDLVGRDA